MEKFDIWALGVTTFEMLFNCRPYYEDKPTKQEVGGRAWIESRIPKWPPISGDMKNLLIGMLKVDPKQRFSHKSILQELSRIMGDPSTLEDVVKTFQSPAQPLVYFVARLAVITDTMFKLEYLLDDENLRISAVTLWSQRCLAMLHCNFVTRFVLHHLNANFYQLVQRGQITQSSAQNTMEKLRLSIKESNESLKKLNSEYQTIENQADEVAATIQNHIRHNFVNPAAEQKTLEERYQAYKRLAKRYRTVTYASLDEIKAVFLAKNLQVEVRLLHLKVASLIAKITFEDYFLIKGEWNNYEHTRVNEKKANWIDIGSYEEVINYLLEAVEGSPSPGKIFLFGNK